MTAAVGHKRIGLDIGGTKVHAVALSPTGSVLAQDRRSSGWGGEEVTGQAADSARAVMARVGWSARDVDVVGIGIPGTVDHRTGEVAQAVNLGLTQLPLAERLSARLGVRVHVENDVNAAALGVASTLEDPTGSLAFLNIGTGLAAGLVLDGALWRGGHGAAGEIGHLPLEADGLACRCGQRGCLETLASGSGMTTQWRRRRGNAPLTMAELPTLAKHDADAAAILSRAQHAIASAVRVLTLTLDVDAIVLGGGVTRLGAPLIDGVLEALRGWEAASPFLASLAPSARVGLLHTTVPVGAVGAALAGSLPTDHPGGSRG